MSKTRSIAVLVLLACAACRGVETAQGAGFVLTSPFGREATGAWKTNVERELALTAAFLGRQIPDPPLDVRLDAVELGPETDVMSHFYPSVDGRGGWTIEGHEVHVIVDAGHDGLLSTSTDGVLRHEFVHVLLYSADHHAPAWLGEGLAHEVEEAIKTADGLRLRPAPVQLPLARAYAKTFDVAQVWTWNGAPRKSSDEESALRILSRSFVRFLIERDGDDWRTHVAEWASMRPADDASLVAAWRKWLDELDFVGRVDRGVHDPDAAVRSWTANALPELAECVQNLGDRIPGLAAEVGPRTDAAAVALVSADDAPCAEAAGRYLVFFRRTAVAESAVRSLAATASPPWTRLTGLALLAKRGERVDPADANAAWARLSDAEQWNFLWLVSFLPIERPRPISAR
jgi:hypothetical protein